jgi:hypothetical protein
MTGGHVVVEPSKYRAEVAAKQWYQVPAMQSPPQGRGVADERAGPNADGELAFFRTCGHKLPPDVADRPPSVADLKLVPMSLIPDCEPSVENQTAQIVDRVLRANTKPGSDRIA